MSSFAQQLLRSLQFSQTRILASLSDLTLTSYDESALILSKGCSVPAWHYVISGYVSASVRLDNGKRLPITMQGRNTWFGEQALLYKQACLHDYTCLTAVEVISMSKKCFELAVLEEPDFLRFLIRQVAGQSGQQAEMLTLMRLGRPPVCVVMGLAQFAESVDPNSTSQQGNASEQALDIPIGQHHLAEICGVSRTLFSEYIQHLARHGWLTLRYGGITLQSLATWRLFAQQQRERPCVTSKPTIHDLLGDMATAHEARGPGRFPNLISKVQLGA